MTGFIIATCIISIIAVIVSTVFLFGNDTENMGSEVIIVYMMAMFPITNLLIIGIIAMVCWEDRE